MSISLGFCLVYGFRGAIAHFYGAKPHRGRPEDQRKTNCKASAVSESKDSENCRRKLSNPTQDLGSHCGAHDKGALFSEALNPYNRLQIFT